VFSYEKNYYVSWLTNFILGFLVDKHYLAFLMKNANIFIWSVLGQSMCLTDGTQTQWDLKNNHLRDNGICHLFHAIMHADSYYMENEYINENLRNSSCFKVSRQVSSPEKISDLEPHSYRCLRVSLDDLELNSPSTPRLFTMSWTRGGKSWCAV
jgi:hypothetical protein